MTTRDKIAMYMKAGNGCLYVVTQEEQRGLAAAYDAAKSIDWKFFTHSAVSGLVEWTTKMEDGKPVIVKTAPDKETCDPMKMLAKLDGLPTDRSTRKGAVVVALDFHALLGSQHAPARPDLVRRVKESIDKCRTELRMLIFMGCRFWLPAELEKLFTVVKPDLPTKEELIQTVRSFKLFAINGTVEEAAIAMMGMTTNQSSDAIALSLAQTGKIDPDILRREKCSEVAKTGLIKVIEPTVTLADIGGLENMKRHIVLIKDMFTDEARDYGLDTPKPILAVGQPGTGKSLTAQALSAVFKLPTLRVSGGALFGSLVGQTEGNWRTVYSTAVRMSPCILWFDEAEQLFLGSESSGKTDGGTSGRLSKLILEDVQDNSNGGGIMFMFTANEIDAMPDPFIDRCDVWSFELPNTIERQEIWAIQIAKIKRGNRKRDPVKYNVPMLSAMSEGYSGRQIEQAWEQAKGFAFQERREPTEADVSAALQQMIPTSITMADIIEARRRRLKDRARCASTPETGKVDNERLIISAN